MQHCFSCIKIFFAGHFLHRPIRKAIPRMNRVGFVNHLLLTVAVRMPQLADDVRSVARRGRLDKSENRAGKEKFVHSNASC